MSFDISFDMNFDLSFDMSFDMSFDLVRLKKTFGSLPLLLHHFCVVQITGCFLPVSDSVYVDVRTNFERHSQSHAAKRALAARAVVKNRQAKARAGGGGD